jgi:hypothetical protein
MHVAHRWRLALEGDDDEGRVMMMVITIIMMVVNVVVDFGAWVPGFMPLLRQAVAVINQVCVQHQISPQVLYATPSHLMCSTSGHQQ